MEVLAAILLPILWLLTGIFVFGPVMQGMAWIVRIIREATTE